MTFSKLTFGSIPNLGKAYDKLVLVERLRDETNINTILGLSIVRDIKSNNITDTNILKMVIDHARNNKEVVEIVIGKELLNDILNLNL